MLESALVLPIQGAATLTAFSYKLFYGLIQKKWFAKMQAKTLLVPDAQFEQHYRDSIKISRESLVHITQSNGSYQMKSGLRKTKAKVLVIAGGKELGIMKKSARMLHNEIPASSLLIVEGMGHGELSLRHPEQYVELLNGLWGPV